MDMGVDTHGGDHLAIVDAAILVHFDDA
jgi:hypothetical protein